jgi:integrase
MKFVEPIRSIQKLNEIKSLLRDKWNIKDLLLIEHGINSALRVSDLLSLRIGDVIDDNWQPRDHYFIKELKTRKVSKVHITPKVKETIVLYQKKYPSVASMPSNYIFFQSRSNEKWLNPISRQQARKIINKVCRAVWLTWQYWWHTLRKTRWYQARKKWISLPIIQEKLNHSSLSITKRYLWITDDEIREASLMLDL